METKRCTKCGIDKPISEYAPRKDRKGALARRADCRDCVRTRTQAWRDSGAGNKEALRAYYKNWKEGNRERVNENSKRFRRLHQDKCRAEAVARSARAREQLSDAYLAARLKLPIADCTPELIELKRQQLTVSRLTKQLKQEIENV